MKHLLLLLLLVALTACSTTGGGGDPAPKLEWPKSTGTAKVNSPRTITGTFDGKMRTYDGAGLKGDCGQSESMEPIFILQNGGKLKNCIIVNAPDGIHVEGDNTLIDHVYFKDVCEDAITIKAGSTNVTVSNSQFAKAEDKVIQVNGGNDIDILNNKFGDGFKSATRWKKAYGGKARVEGNDFINGQRAVVMDSGAKTPEIKNNRYFNTTPLHKG